MEAHIAPGEVQFDAATQVRLDRPDRWCHSVRGRLMAARRAREWSWNGSAGKCGQTNSRLAVIMEVIGGWLVLWHTLSLVTWATCTYWIWGMRQRHHWSNASRRRLETEVMLYVSAPYRMIGRM